MKLKTISRRSFLKGAGVTALAVAAAGMMTACGDSSSSKKDPVSPVPTPTTHDVTVKFVSGQATGADVYDEITIKNVDFAKLPTPPVLTKEDLAQYVPTVTDYEFAKDSYPIVENDGKYVVYAVMKKKTVEPGKQTVTIEYVEDVATGGTRSVTDKVVDAGGKATVEVAADVTKISTEGLLPTACSYVLACGTSVAIVEGVATVKVAKQ